MTKIVHYEGFQDFLTHMAAERPDSIALLHGANDKYNRVTWVDFVADINARAKELRASGKTCIAILADGSYACVVEIFAANIAGLQIAMLDTAVPDKMLSQLLPYVDADMLWCPNEQRAEQLSNYLISRASDGAGKILFFTSGTTSRAKAVTLTDSSLMASAFGGSGTFPLESGDVLLCVLPLAHVFGFVCCLLWPWLCGATVALGRGGRHVFDDWSYFHPTATSVVPILLEHLLRRNIINPELQAILVGAGDAPQERLDEVKERGIRLAFGYGLTETSSGVAISAEGEDDPHALEVCPGSTITIADDGEVLIQTPGAMMQGYYKMPADTAEVLVDGVLHTGDLGSFDENGRLHLQGRKKETLVLPGGTKIFLPEYEREIAEQLGTSEIAVVLRRGMPVLVLDDLADDTRDAVMTKLKDVMDGWQNDQRLADVIELGHELPRTATGKVQRWLLEAEIGQRFKSLRNFGKKDEAKTEAPAAEAEDAPEAAAEAAPAPEAEAAPTPAVEAAPVAAAEPESEPAADDPAAEVEE
ncbi:MAG: class I adenylate-forming enzyme family protein [Atopobiaceae bacterium]|nr:class I adenylate-forming enzyme family protein [Atopobiaceae bacterium]